MDDEMNDDIVRQMNVSIPGGKQIHATQNLSDGEGWKEDTYLYLRDNGAFYFEQYANDGHSGHTTLFITRNELKEYVTKLLPLLFTPEELKRLGEGPPTKDA